MASRSFGARSPPPPLPSVRGRQPRFMAHERRPIGRAPVVPSQRRRLLMPVTARRPRIRNDLEQKSNFGEGLRKSGRIPIAVPDGVMARPTPGDLYIEVLQYILDNKSYFT